LSRAVLGPLVLRGPKRVAPKCLGRMQRPVGVAQHLARQENAVRLSGCYKGETKTRFLKVTSRIVNGVKSVGFMTSSVSA
jgi:hypothetical protein